MGTNNKLPRRQVEYITTFDRLLAFHREDDGLITLSEEEQRVYARWDQAFTHLCQYKSTNDVVKMLCRRHGVSKKTAYNDIKNAQDLFGDVFESSKKAMRHLASEWAKEIYRMAKAKGDLKAMAMAHANFVKTHRLDTAEAEAFDYSKLEPNVYNFELSAENINILQLIAGQGAVNLSQMRDSLESKKQKRNEHKGGR